MLKFSKSSQLFVYVAVVALVSCASWSHAQVVGSWDFDGNGTNETVSKSISGTRTYFNITGSVTDVFHAPTSSSPTFTARQLDNLPGLEAVFYSNFSGRHDFFLKRYYSTDVLRSVSYPNTRAIVWTNVDSVTGDVELITYQAQYGLAEKYTFRTNNLATYIFLQGVVAGGVTSPAYYVDRIQIGEFNGVVGNDIAFCRFPVNIGPAPGPAGQCYADWGPGRIEVWRPRDNTKTAYNITGPGFPGIFAWVNFFNGSVATVSDGDTSRDIRMTYTLSARCSNPAGVPYAPTTTFVATVDDQRRVLTQTP